MISGSRVVTCRQTDRQTQRSENALLLQLIFENTPKTIGCSCIKSSRVHYVQRLKLRRTRWAPFWSNAEFVWSLFTQYLYLTVQAEQAYKGYFDVRFLLLFVIRLTMGILKSFVQQNRVPAHYQLVMVVTVSQRDQSHQNVNQNSSCSYTA